MAWISVNMHRVLDEVVVVVQLSGSEQMCRVVLLQLLLVFILERIVPHQHYSVFQE